MGGFGAKREGESVWIHVEGLTIDLAAGYC